MAASGRAAGLAYTALEAEPVEWTDPSPAASSRPAISSQRGIRPVGPSVQRHEQQTNKPRKPLVVQGVVEGAPLEAALQLSVGSTAPARAKGTASARSNIPCPLLLACACREDDPHASSEALFFKASDDELAGALQMLLVDQTRLADECDGLFSTCLPSSRLGPAVEMSPFHLSMVTQRIINRLRCRHPTVLERVSDIFESITAGAGSEYGQAGLSRTQFRGFVAAVLTQILKGIQEPCSAASRNMQAEGLNWTAESFEEEDGHHVAASVAREEEPGAGGGFGFMRWTRDAILGGLDAISRRVQDDNPGEDERPEVAAAGGAAQVPELQTRAPGTEVPWMQQSATAMHPPQVVDGMHPHSDVLGVPRGVRESEVSAGLPQSEQDFYVPMATGVPAALATKEESQVGSPELGFAQPGGADGFPADHEAMALMQQPHSSLDVDHLPGAFGHAQGQPAPLGDEAGASAHAAEEDEDDEDEEEEAKPQQNSPPQQQEKEEEVLDVRDQACRVVQLELGSDGLPAYVAVEESWQPRWLAITGGRRLYVVDSDGGGSVHSLLAESACFELRDLRQVTRKSMPGLYVLTLHFEDGLLLLRFSYQDYMDGLIDVLVEGRNLPILEARS